MTVFSFSTPDSLAFLKKRPIAACKLNENYRNCYKLVGFLNAKTRNKILKQELEIGIHP